MSRHRLHSSRRCCSLGFRATAASDVHRFRVAAHRASISAARDRSLLLYSATDLVYLLPRLDARLPRDAIVAGSVWNPLEESKDRLGVVHPLTAPVKRLAIAVLRS